MARLEPEMTEETMREIRVVDNSGRVVEVIKFRVGCAELPRIDHATAFNAFMQDPDDYFSRLEAGEFHLHGH